MASHTFRSTVIMLAGAVACTAFGYYLGDGAYGAGAAGTGPASTGLPHGAGAS